MKGVEYWNKDKYLDVMEQHIIQKCMHGYVVSWFLSNWPM